MNEIWEALDRLENGEKWGKSYLYDPETGSRCQLGSLVGATEMTDRNYDKWDDLSSVKLVASIIMEEFPERTIDTLSKFMMVNPTDIIWAFNDCPRTTFTDVSIVMEKAAIRLDEQV